MRTNATITRNAFEEWFSTYMDGRTHSESIDELELIFENNDSHYYLNFMQSKRVKAHSGAFYAVILALRPFMPNGYYASNPQIKANILHYFGMDYKAFLRPLVERLEKSRENYLK